MRYTTLLFLLYFYLLPVGTAQNIGQITDSLQTTLAKENTDSGKVHILCDLAWHYRRTEPDKAKQHGYEALRLAEETGLQPLIAKCYGRLGNIFYTTGELPDAKQFFIKSIELWKEISDSVQLAKNYANLSNVIGEMGDYALSLEYNLQSIAFFESMHDSLSASKLLLNTGAIYMEMDRYDKALEYFLHAAKYFESAEDIASLAVAFQNAGGVHFYKKSADSALQYFLLAKNCALQLGDSVGLARSHYYIGTAYYLKQLYDKALEENKQALALSEKMGDLGWLNGILINIGQIYADRNEPSLALEYYKRSLDISLQIGTKEEEKDVYKHIAMLYQKINKPSDALHYYIRYSELKDTLLNAKVSEQITNMNTRYETEKKEKQLQIQELEISKKDAENKKQRIAIFAVIAGFVLVAAFAFFIFTRMRIIQNQKNVIEQQKNLVDKQYTELQKANKTIENKNKDIMDSIRYAERIQQAILPFTERIRDGLKELDADFFVLFKPKDVVSGDFYWFHYNPETKTALFAVTDCTGHGVPGAFLSMIGNDLLNHIVIVKGITSPQQILYKLNAGIRYALQQDQTRNRDGMDIALICLQKTKNGMRLQYAGAKNPLIYVKNTELYEVKAAKFPVGGMMDQNDKERKYEHFETELSCGNMVYILSDGFQDQFGGPNEKKFMLKNLKEKLRSIATLHPDEQKKILNVTIDEWIMDGEQVDDITIVGVRV